MARRREAHTITSYRPRPTSTAGSRHQQLTSSDHVIVGSPEETVLETYYVMLSKMNFDKARDQCERERAIKSESGGGANWCDFISALGQLARAESAYFSLTYLEKSWRRKREPPKAAYENIFQELTKVYEVYICLKGGTDITWERKMADLVQNTRDYLLARKDLMDFYLRFDQAGEGFHLDFKSHERLLREIHERYKDSCEHVFLRPVKNVLLREIATLQDLVSAQQLIGDWQFLPAIIALQSAHSKLLNWHHIVPLGNQGDRVARALHHSRQASPPPQSSLPRLYKWICSFFTYLMAKFTLYFHGTLSEHAIVYNMKHLSSKIDRDYINSLSILHRQIPSNSLALVFDSNGLPDFKGPKYSFPGSPVPVLTGLNSYPFMLSIPQGFDFYHHRANIVSLIMSKGSHLSTSPQVIAQHDDKLQCTYFLTQIDVRVTLIAICTSTRSGKDRDSKTMSAISEFANNLRPNHLSSLLRNN